MTELPLQVLYTLKKQDHHPLSSHFALEEEVFRTSWRF